MRLSHLLLIAMCFHVSAATGVYLAGRLEVAPGTFGKDGIATFASDSRVYQLQINALQKTLKEEGPVSWLRTPAPVHVKLYSLSYALFSPLFGQTILSAEPLNLLYYLTTLLLIFLLGKETFGEKEGLLAAAMCVLLLPTFLLHTTQLLKDPLFIVLGLVLLLVSVKWLTSELTMISGLTMGALGGAAAASIWLVKNSFWWLALAIMLLGAALSVARQTWQRKVIAGNLAGAALMLAIALSASQFVKPYFLPTQYWTPYRSGAETTSAPATMDSSAPDGSTSITSEHIRTLESQQPHAVWSRVARRIAITRAKFIALYPEASSNVDTHVQLSGTYDVVRYLPRAMVVGLCAPFPRMWFGTGANTGRWGRLLSGCETILMCLVELLAFQSFWHRRRQLPVWLLMLIALIGVTALGLVVVNLGALYRQRYLFWILFLVMAADTCVRIVRSRLTPSPLQAVARAGSDSNE